MARHPRSGKSLALLLASLFVAHLISAPLFADTPRTVPGEAPFLAVTAPTTFTVTVEGQGPPMVMIPGLACGREVWDETAEVFADRYTIHRLHLAGFAGQPAVEGSFLPRVRDELAAYLRQLRDLGNSEAPVLVGHSLGAVLSLWLGATEPDLVGAIVAVDGVPFLPALIDPNATEHSARPQAEGLRGMLLALDAEQFAAQNRRSLETMITDPADVDRVAARSRHSDPAAVAQAMVELMTTDLRPQMARVQAPVLMVAASAHATTDTAHEALRQAYDQQIKGIANRQLVLAEARHFVMLDDFDFLVQSMTTFLDDAESFDSVADAESRSAAQ